MPGKGNETMVDVRRSLSGGQSIRPVGMVQRSMPALTEPEHAVGTLPIATEQQTRMLIRVTRDTQHVARKRLVLPRHSTSPARLVMDMISNAIRGRLIVEGSAIPLLGEHGTYTDIFTNVNTVAMGPLEPVQVTRLSRGSKTLTTHTTEASTSHVVVVPAIVPTDPLKNVPPHSMAGNVAIVPGDGQRSLLREYTWDADGYWQDAMDIRYSRIEPVR